MVTDARQMDGAKLRKAKESFQLIWASLSSAAFSAGGEELLQALRSLGDALERCGEPVERILERHGLPMAAAVAPAPSAGSPSAHLLQTTEVSRAFTFVDRATAWLSDHADAEVSENDLKNLQLMARLTFETRRVIGAALTGGLLPDQPPSGALGEGVVAGPGLVTADGPSPSGTTLYSGELVLVDTPEAPLLQERGDKVEATPHAKELVNDFLDDARLQMDAKARQKLTRNVEKWLLSTPEGMALVIRIGELQGKPQPYPKYIPKPAVADAESD